MYVKSLRKIAIDEDSKFIPLFWCFNRITQLFKVKNELSISSIKTMWMRTPCAAAHNDTISAFNNEKNNNSSIIQQGK